MGIEEQVARSKQPLLHLIVIVISVVVVIVIDIVIMIFVTIVILITATPSQASLLLSKLQSARIGSDGSRKVVFVTHRFAVQVSGFEVA